MELVEQMKNIQPLTVHEMVMIEAGAWVIPWGAVAVGLALNFLTNLPDAIEGAIDGWNAVHH